MAGKGTYRYEWQGRNGYTCIDLYQGGTCLYNAIAGLDEQSAKLICSELNTALHFGRTEKEH